MDLKQIPKALGDFISTAEPLVICLFFCGILFLGWILGKGTAKAKRKIFGRKPPASSKELLE